MEYRIKNRRGKRTISKNVYLLVKMIDDKLKENKALTEIIIPTSEIDSMLFHSGIDNAEMIAIKSNSYRCLLQDLLNVSVQISNKGNKTKMEFMVFSCAGFNCKDQYVKINLNEDFLDYIKNYKN